MLHLILVVAAALSFAASLVLPVYWNRLIAVGLLCWILSTLAI